MSTLSYQPHIDGLRAVAVIAVLGFHAFPSWVSGGYIGVDVFFVISGYLISSIIFKELEHTHSFSFQNFYARRFIRLFPALLLVLAATLLLGWLLLFAFEFKDLGKHTVAGIGYVSNLLLLSEVGYFDQAAETKPLLHLWSLGIEEQFYLLWPLALWLIWRFAAKPYRLWWLIGLLAISLVAHVYCQLAGWQEAAFYLPVTRFWELLAGGLLGYWLMFKQPESATHVTANLVDRYGLWQRVSRSNGLTVVALLALLVLFVLYSNDTQFLPAWPLLPVLAAMALVVTSSSQVSQWLLSNRVMVFIGLISYPLYLWHWPLLVYLHLVGWDTSLGKLLAIAVSVLLAAGTLYCVERPMKRLPRQSLLLGLFVMSGLIAAAGVAAYTAHWPARHDAETTKLLQATDDWTFPAGMQSFEYQGQGFHREPGLPSQVLFYGDSHMQQYAPRIAKVVADNSSVANTAVFATMSGCPPIPHVGLNARPACNSDFRDAVESYIMNENVQAVVLAARWDIYLGDDIDASNQFFVRPAADGQRYELLESGTSVVWDNLETMLSRWRERFGSGKAIYLVMDNPADARFHPKNHLVGSRLAGYSVDLAKDASIAENQAQAELRQKMLALAERFDINVIDMYRHFCENGQCQLRSPENLPAYRDYDHMRASYVEQYVTEFDDLLVNSSK